MATEIKDGSYNPNLLERKFTFFPQNFYKGYDVVTASSVVLPECNPHTKKIDDIVVEDQHLSLKLTAECIPALDYLSYEDFFHRSPCICFRSRLAQLGLHAPKDSLPNALTPKKYAELKRTQTVTVDMEFVNFCKRPLIIPENYPLFRIVIKNPRAYARGFKRRVQAELVQNPLDLEGEYSF